MTDLLPYLQEKSFGFKILVLLFLILILSVVTLLFGFVFGIPIFGMDIIGSFSGKSDYADAKTVQIAKYFQVVSQLGVFVFPALAYAYLETRKPTNYLRIQKSPMNFSLLISLVLVFVLVPGINWMVEINEQMALPTFLQGIEEWMKNAEGKAKVITEAFLSVDTIGGLLINLFIIAFLAAVGEELLFRGVIFRILFNHFKNIHVAVWVSAIVFSAFHLQFYGFLPRAVLGVIFAYIFGWTANLWIVIILHFVFNGMTVVAAYLYNKNIITTDYETMGSTNNIYFVIGSLLVSVLVLVMIKKINSKNKKRGNTV